MNVWDESKNGVIFSMISPLVLSFFAALFGGISEAISTSVLNGFGAAISLFFLFVVVSGVISTLASIFIGVPVYYVLRKLGLVNPVLITSIGGVVALLCSLSDVNSWFTSLLFIVYGVCSGFLFWYGAKYASKEL